MYFRHLFSLKLNLGHVRLIWLAQYLVLIWHELNKLTILGIKCRYNIYTNSYTVNILLLTQVFTLTQSNFQQFLFYLLLINQRYLNSPISQSSPSKPSLQTQEKFSSVFTHCASFLHVSFVHNCLSVISWIPQILNIWNKVIHIPNILGILSNF